MYGMKLEDLLKEDDAAPPQAAPQQFWEPTKPATAKGRRKWPIVIATVAIAAIVLSGLAIAGTQGEPTAQVEVATVAERDAWLSNMDVSIITYDDVLKEKAKKEQEPIEPNKPPIAAEAQTPAPAPRAVAAAPVKAAPVETVKPAKPTETAEEIDKRVRAKVIAEREAKQPKIVIEEPDENPPIRQIYMRLGEAEEAAAKTGKPLLKWTGGSRDKVPADIFAKLDKDFTHFTSTAGDTKVEWKDAAGLSYEIRPPYTERTPNVIKSKFGLVAFKDKFPQIDYPINYRNRNLPDGGGCCVWASVSTLAYVHGYNFRLEDNRRGGSTPYHAVQVLKRNGIPAQWTDMTRKKNVQYLRDACDAGLGCTVGVCLGYQGPMPMLHEINLAGINDTHAAILDNNDRQLKVRVVPIDKFLSMWDGSSVVIFPKGKEDALAKYGKRSLYGQVNPSKPRDLSDEGPAARPGPSDDIGSFDPTGCYGNASQILDAWKSAGYTEDELKAKAKGYRDYRQ